jgi:hypothetical protein
MLYNHRIVPDNSLAHSRLFIDGKDRNIYWDDAETIHMPSEWTAEQLVVLAGITSGEWKEIILDYIREGWVVELISAGEAIVKSVYEEGKLTLSATPKYSVLKPFSRYLSDLISLAISGLTVEEIKELYETSIA